MDPGDDLVLPSDWHYEIRLESGASKPYQFGSISTDRLPTFPPSKGWCAVDGASVSHSIDA
ncbi:hypothetical protein D8Y22_16920 [Salinadaptatus halalkaliphilus]|uniref:Cupin domain-containing protein n=1 Tax=Salinadaptatus halalkaliphilus TaxID=2419781 RepID=A0A4S3THV1_9EURY|nr:hypothetical protein D8Y22_16920 [Salinadaptatus halalkaliphilus]